MTRCLTGGASRVGDGRDHNEGAPHLPAQPVPPQGGARDQAGDVLGALISHPLPEKASLRPSSFRSHRPHHSFSLGLCFFVFVFVFFAFSCVCMPVYRCNLQCVNAVLLRPHECQSGLSEEARARCTLFLNRTKQPRPEQVQDCLLPVTLPVCAFCKP